MCAVWCIAVTFRCGTGHGQAITGHGRRPSGKSLPSPNPSATASCCSRLEAPNDYSDCRVSPLCGQRMPRPPFGQARSQAIHKAVRAGWRTSTSLQACHCSGRRPSASMQRPCCIYNTAGRLTPDAAGDSSMNRFINDS